MIQIIIFTVIAIAISFFIDKHKTIKGVKKGLKQFIKILPTLLSVLMIISVILYFISDKFIIEQLGNSAGIEAYISAAMVGSISILPGFITYPLSGILVKSGVSFAVISVFITTLKMVGFLIIPIESKYFGLKTAILRNSLSLVGALLVGSIMALIYNFI